VGLLGVLIHSMSNQSAGITSRSMLFLPGKDAWVKRSFLEIEGDADLSQNRVWAQKKKKPLNTNCSTASDVWRAVLRT
jgi:hypothetical protein